MEKDKTGIEILLQQKIEREIFSPLSEECMNRMLFWLQEVAHEHYESRKIPQHYFNHLGKLNPEDYTAFFLLKKSGIIKESGDFYCLSEEGLKINSSLKKEGVYDSLDIPLDYYFATHKND